MLGKYIAIVVVVLAVAASACDSGSFKRFNNQCACGDRCLNNSVCLTNGRGLSCQCLPCQYFDRELGQCVDKPGHSEVCRGVCQSNFECAADDDGAKRCTCNADKNMFYDKDSDSCIYIPCYGCSCTDRCQPGLECVNGTCQCPSGKVFDATLKRCSFACMDPSNSKSCEGQRDGDYPICYPRCKQGQFITCSNEFLHVRDCALGWYVTPDGSRFTSKLVYDPIPKRCERKASYCPRALDDLIEE